MKEIMTLSDVNKFKIKAYREFASQCSGDLYIFDSKKYGKLKREFLKNTKFMLVK